jgi:hypothetical protein
MWRQQVYNKDEKATWKEIECIAKGKNLEDKLSSH